MVPRAPIIMVTTMAARKRGREGRASPALAHWFWS
jgi:hypothetical protein